MTYHYATIYRGKRLCAAYRRGVLVILRKKDNAHTMLTLKETNELVTYIRANGMGYDVGHAFDGLAAAFEKRMKKHKAVYSGTNGEFINVNMQHVKPRLEQET